MSTPSYHADVNAATQVGGSSSSAAPAAKAVLKPAKGPLGVPSEAENKESISAPAEDEDDILTRRRLVGKQKDPAIVKSLARIHAKLRDKAELLKLHLKHKIQYKDNCKD